MSSESKPLGRRGGASVRVENVRVARVDHGFDITFDVGWDRSWRFGDGRRSNNWDAVWIFIKYSTTLNTQTADVDATIAALDAGDAKTLLSKLAGNRSALSFADAEGHSNPILTATHLASSSADDRDDVEIVQVVKGRKWGINLLLKSRGVSASDETVGERIEVDLVTASDGSRQLRFRKPGIWRHAVLSPSDHRAPPGGELDVAEDGLGAFLHRDAQNLGEGPVAFRGVTLRWQRPDPALIDQDLTFWVQAWEMVYIPEGAYSLGDPMGPQGPTNCFYDASLPSTTTDRSYRVESEDKIVVSAIAPPGGGRCLYYNKDNAVGAQGDRKGPIEASYPKGYKAYYLMKRMVSQGQFADFINLLPGHGKTTRFPYGAQGDYRYEVYKTPSGPRVATRPDRPCHWISWSDSIAIACWAGLRPMTELEFEKACRGPTKAVCNEYAWGSTSLDQAHVIVGDESSGEEVVSGNCHFENTTSPFRGGDGGLGPVRDDAFGPAQGAAGAIFPGGRASFSAAAGAEPTVIEPNVREQSGASYYGVASLSGNLWEFCVSVSISQGRAFTGKNGTGALDDSGVCDAEALLWPGDDAIGSALRGGSWFTSRSSCRVADRSGGAGGYPFRAHDVGMRCARTAPVKGAAAAIPPHDPQKT
jgi:formylglycine-generating enzyme required for sulfatase activity